MAAGQDVPRAFVMRQIVLNHQKNNFFENTQFSLSRKTGAHSAADQGCSVFLIASFVYLSTIEQTVSFWDCGEYIATAYKLEVGHPPGAPLFQLFGRIFTLFASPATSEVAVAVNIMSALCSSFTIVPSSTRMTSGRSAIHFFY